MTDDGAGRDRATSSGLPAQPGRPESGVPLDHPPGADELPGAGTPDGFRRLWAPHRMAYIAGESGTGEVDGGCPLCAIPQRSDEDGLVVARGDLVYAVLNLHPYNPGHLMVVPYRHVALLDDLTDEESIRAHARHPAGPARAACHVLAARVQRRDQPRACRRRLARRPPAPARGPALGR